MASWFNNLFSRRKTADQLAAEASALISKAQKQKDDAHTKLRIVVDLIDKEMFSPQVLRSPEPGRAQLLMLTRASEYLNDARKLDPTATTARQLDPKEPPINFSIDELAINILALEVDAHLSTADAQHQLAFDIIKKTEAKVSGSIGTGDLKYIYKNQETMLADNDKMVREKLRLACSAIEKYLKYRPNDREFLRKHARALAGLKQHKQARKVAQRALSLDPNDIQTIKLVDEQKQW